MVVIWLNTSIKHNRLRLIYLMSLLPLVTIIVIFLYNLFIYNGNIDEVFWNNFITINSIFIPILLVWLFVWVMMQKKIIFSFTWAKEVDRKWEPEIYNIVENLCISKWLVVPKIAIIEDNGMNAFATWWSKNDSYIIFSRWLINKLEKDEIEAVAAHELTHIINWDVKNMVIINVFIWAIWTIWYILMRTWSRRSSKWNNPLPLLWLFLYLASIILLPLINLAISRKKEFLADAWSATLTKNPEWLIRALKKISTDSIIENIDWKWRNVASMFIANPRVEPKFLASIRSMFLTHPTIESRIELLQKY